jgi:hypothetical protein
MFKPAEDERTAARQGLDEQIATEAPLAPLDLPVDTSPSAVENHLSGYRHREGAEKGDDNGW